MSRNSTVKWITQKLLKSRQPNRRAAGNIISSNAQGLSAHLSKEKVVTFQFKVSVTFSLLIYCQYNLTFQLVSVFNGDTELTPAEMRECLLSRVKNKPIVTIKLSNGHIEVRQSKNKV